jgi:hypothetical protein
MSVVYWTMQYWWFKHLWCVSDRINNNLCEKIPKVAYGSQQINALEMTARLLVVPAFQQWLVLVSLPSPMYYSIFTNVWSSLFVATLLGCRILADDPPSVRQTFSCLVHLSLGMFSLKSREWRLTLSFLYGVDLAASPWWCIPCPHCPWCQDARFAIEIHCTNAHQHQVVHQANATIVLEDDNRWCSSWGSCFPFVRHCSWRLLYLFYHHLYFQYVICASIRSCSAHDTFLCKLESDDLDMIPVLLFEWYVTVNVDNSHGSCQSC